MGGPFSTELRFGAADLNRRVTLRRQLDGAPGEPAEFGDLVGVLESWSDGVLSLRRRDGELVEVPETAMRAGRVVAPERSAEDTALAELTQRLGPVGFAAAERLGDWVVHLDPQAAGGALVLAVGDPGGPVDQALALVAARCRADGQRPVVTVIEPSPAADAARAAGWPEQARFAVRTPRPAVSARPSRADLVPTDEFHVDEITGPVELAEDGGLVLHHVQVVFAPAG